MPASSLDTLRERFERYLAELPFAAELEALTHAMRYSLDGGGKRIRPVLCLATGEAAGAEPGSLLPAAAAIELVHTFGMVHDDLPALDDDDERRGRATSHVRFDEATGVVPLPLLPGDTEGSAASITPDGRFIAGFSGDDAVFWDENGEVHGIADTLEAAGVDLGGFRPRGSGPFASIRIVADGKLLYGSLELRGLGMTSTKAVLESTSALRAKLQSQIRKARPTVVALLLCSRDQAERYRDGAQAFVDRVFFQEEIEDCLSFLRQAVARAR